jgi:hypothetical protein
MQDKYGSKVPLQRDKAIAAGENLGTISGVKRCGSLAQGNLYIVFGICSTVDSWICWRNVSFIEMSYSEDYF